MLLRSSTSASGRDRVQRRRSRSRPAASACRAPLRQGPARRAVLAHAHLVAACPAPRGHVHSRSSARCSRPRIPRGARGALRKPGPVSNSISARTRYRMNAMERAATCSRRATSPTDHRALDAAGVQHGHHVLDRRGFGIGGGIGRPSLWPWPRMSHTITRNRSRNASICPSHIRQVAL